MQNVLNEQEQKEWEAVLQRQNNARQMVSTFHYGNAHSKITPQLEAAYMQWKNGQEIVFESGSNLEGAL